jgi:hypothetical protein
MSKAEDLRYQIERKRRQQLFEERVRRTTGEHLARHAAILDDLAAQGLSPYVTREFAQAQQQLSRAEQLLRDDPVAARELSVRIGADVHRLPSLALAAFRAAREAQARFEAERVQREEAAAEALEDGWREALGQWDDLLARQLAQPVLANLRRAALMPGAERATPAELAAAISKIRADAGAKADGVRAAAREEAEAESRAHLQAQLQQAGQEAPPGSGGQTLAELAGQLSRAVADADEAAVNEQARREVVAAVNQALLDAGFVTEKPRRLRVDGGDEVLLRAVRPSGAEAAFRIGLGGVMHYEFDKYEGTACRKDIDQVLPTLQSVYGITLSDRRVVWENPDDLDQQARPRPETNRDMKNG